MIMGGGVNPHSPQILIIIPLFIIYHPPTFFFFVGGFDCFSHHQILGILTDLGIVNSLLRNLVVLPLTLSISLS